MLQRDAGARDIPLSGLELASPERLRNQDGGRHIQINARKDDT